MTKIIFTRHGETLWNIEGRVQGALDSPLTTKGILQARKLGQRLQGEGITRIYSSDLPRAQATADEIRQELSLQEVLLHPGLRELSFGEWEGESWWDLRKLYPELFAIWDKGPHQIQIPGGETMWEVTDRAWLLVQELARHHAGETLCIVTHGMTLQLIVKKALGIPVEQWEDVPWQHNTAVNIFEFYDDGDIKPLVIADHSHLDDEIKSTSGITTKSKPE
ncbi:MAG: histidine phosphatase family protein [Desulfitobacterium sp.]